MGEIRKFYEDKTVFVTGATGFLGKMTVEKLLRSCNVKKIILLFRSKKGENAVERYEKFFNSPMFEILANEKPDFKLKIEVIDGDLKLPNLGLKPDDVNKILREVEVIFHWAATVNFAETLKVACDINVKGLRDLLRMAKNMPHLKSFLYVSTAYSHCLLKEVDEVFYDETFPPNEFIDSMDSINEKVAADITPQLLGDWPNSYVFTKAIAEKLIQTNGNGLPVGILRPSIITPSYKEPVIGWVDNLYGYTGLALASGLGFIKVMPVDENMKVNLVPADYVVNCAIASSWQISNKKTDIPIYNYTDSNEHSLTIRETDDLTYKYGMQYPTKHMMWHHVVIRTTNTITFVILDYLLHYLPAYLMDFFSPNRKIRFLKIYYKFYKLMGTTRFFSTRQWIFNNNNVTTLWKTMSKNDRELFEFDMNALDWEEYKKNSVLGMRAYILKDTLDTVPAAKRKLVKLMIIHYTVVSILLFAFAYVTYMILKFVS